MIDVSALFCGKETASQPHRYGKALKNLSPAPEQAHKLAKSAKERRPVVVWNCTRTCNLRCVHCYSDSEAKKYPGELSSQEAWKMILDLGKYQIPTLLFSGGEPLLRKDLFALAYEARSMGTHTVISTNGTLIDEKMADHIVESRLSYVGISLDGVGETNDRFRGMEGAFRRAVRGMRFLVERGQKVGLRMTLTRQNAHDLNQIFDFIEKEGIRRACFYHLVPSGRGHSLVDLTPEEARGAVDTILERTRDFYQRGLDTEILTVDNHCDGPYLYLKMLEEKDPRSEEVHQMLAWNGGGLHSSGTGIACIDFVGNVHPDQFWMDYTLGNVRERAFSEIWQDESEPLLGRLRDRKRWLKGRCSSCRFLDLCGGAMRVRAERAYGDPWASDPSCYLTDKEIGLQ
jgi:radical SAM protein with 4Fe4S-binding SPASM domain